MNNRLPDLISGYLRLPIQGEDPPDANGRVYTADCVAKMLAPLPGPRFGISMVTGQLMNSCGCGQLYCTICSPGSCSGRCTKCQAIVLARSHGECAYCVMALPGSVASSMYASLLHRIKNILANYPAPLSVPVGDYLTCPTCIGVYHKGLMHCPQCTFGLTQACHGCGDHNAVALMPCARCNAVNHPTLMTIQTTNLAHGWNYCTCCLGLYKGALGSKCQDCAKGNYPSSIIPSITFGPKTQSTSPVQLIPEYTDWDEPAPVKEDMICCPHCYNDTKKDAIKCGICRRYLNA